VVPYSSRISLLVSRDGTSSFDLVTRETQPLTKTQVVAAGGGTLIGRACAGDRCTLSAIDFETRNERALRVDVPIDDLRDVLLSPNGRYLALSRKSAGHGRFVEIVDVATALAYWHSPDGVSFTGAGPAWSWSPDSTRFFVTMSAQRVIAVDVREYPFRTIDIEMPHTPFHGIAVTAR
jgi:WD40 repeat protein